MLTTSGCSEAQRADAHDVDPREPPSQPKYRVTAMKNVQKPSSRGQDDRPTNRNVIRRAMKGT